MLSLIKHKNKVISISITLVLCLMVSKTSIISTTSSADITEGSKKAGSLNTPYCNGVISSWMWVSGNKTTNHNGTYGTKGISDMANYPGAREESVSWNGTDGHLWLFGGLGYNESGDFGRLNDLWRYNITSKEWAWMSGNKTINENGVYGTKGVPDTANYPGARYRSASWTDTDGNFWLFGGYGHNESGDFGRLNDLWRFNITSKEWAWMSGNKTTDEYGDYSTKGFPGARYLAVSWTDTDGNLWLFGGNGYAKSTSGYLNDLWRFNITSKEWAFISGWDFTNQGGAYGTKGEPDSMNDPGARSMSVSWTDSDGNLWLFGGDGYDEGSGVPGLLNDLWRFNLTSKEWAWMSGDKTMDENGIYGTKGVPDSANYPGGRESPVSWTDKDGKLWLFGGYGYAESSGPGPLNDLWRFDISSKKWAWMSGDKTLSENGVYGTKGVPDSANYPGARAYSVSWTDTDGNFWLYGGYGRAESASGWLNDLWRLSFAEKSQPGGQIPSTDDDDDDDKKAEAIPGYRLYLIIGTICVISAILIKKRLSPNRQN